MRILLDTHIFLWLVTDDRKAKKSLRTQIEAATEVYVSAASVWEVAIKHALGKLDGDPVSFHQAIDTFGFRELPITGEHTLAVAKLPPIHKDPFDRLLIAQAITEPLTLFTADALLIEYSDLVRHV
jgi:PIN domain nuclease of toxin-antitoxin system